MPNAYNRLVKNLRAQVRYQNQKLFKLGVPKESQLIMRPNEITATNQSQLEDAQRRVSAYKQLEWFKVTPKNAKAYWANTSLRDRAAKAADYANKVIQVDYEMAKARQDKANIKYGKDPQPPVLASDTPRPYKRKLESFPTLKKFLDWERRAWNAGNTNQWAITDEELKRRLVDAVRGPRGLQGWEHLGDFIEEEVSPSMAYEMFHVYDLNFEYIYGPESVDRRAQMLIKQFIEADPNLGELWSDPNGKYYDDFVRAGLALIDEEE